jgi:hypothetical protein
MVANTDAKTRLELVFTLFTEDELTSPLFSSFSIKVTDIFS